MNAIRDSFRKVASEVYGLESLDEDVIEKIEDAYMDGFSTCFFYFISRLPQMDDMKRRFVIDRMKAEMVRHNSKWPKKEEGG